MNTGSTYLEALQKLFEEAKIPISFGEKGVRTKYQYRYPKEVPLNGKEKVYTYLAQRHISKETIDAVDVREDAQGNIVFNYYDANDVLCLVKYRPSHKIDKSKGELKAWCQKDADTTPLLFNMNKVNTTQPLLVTEGECFPGDAEVFTNEGWVQFKNFEHQKVLQVTNDAGVLGGEFITPNALIHKKYNGDMQVYRSGGNYSSITTENHNIVFFDYKGDLQKRKACEMPTSIGGNGYIPTTIKLEGNGIQLSYDQISLYLAVSADCTIDVRKTTRHCRFAVKKKRKYLRLKTILDSLKIPYFENAQAGNDYLYIGFTTPDWLLSKSLPMEWATQATQEQRNFILEEMVYWDGNKVPSRDQTEYASTIYSNAELMQTMAHTSGKMSTIITRSNSIGKWYKVSILYGKKGISCQRGFGCKEHFEGDVYCVNTNTGMILVRQEGHITVSGNCDCMAAIEAGFTNAVSVPLGANNYAWIEENFDWLEQFDSIIICSDNDEAGIKMQKECVFRLGSWRTKFIDVPPFHYDAEQDKKFSMKDLNHVLYYQGKDSVIELIHNAKDSPVDSVSDFSDINNIDLDEIDGIKTGIPDLDKKLMKLFYGTFTIVTGVNGSGKSSFLSQLVCNAIDDEKNAFLYSGELPNFQSKNWVNYILAGQRNIKEYNSNGATYWKVTQEAQKAINDYYRSRLFIYKDGYDHKVKSILKSMEDTTRKYGCKLHIIDNLTAVNLEANDQNKYQRQEEFVTNLIDFAKKYNVAVVLVVHPHKIEQMRRLNKMDIQGISAIIDLAHRILSLYRVTQEDRRGVPNKRGGWYKEPIKYDVLCDILKDRLLGHEGSSAGLYYDKPSRRFFIDSNALDIKFSWDKTQYTSPLPFPPLQLVSNDEDEVYGNINGGG